MDYEQIEAMVAVLRETSRVTELEVRSGDTVVRLRRPPPPRQKKSDKSPREKASQQTAVASTASGSPASPSAPATKGTLVTAHLVGIFRPIRTAPVTVGDSIKSGQVLGSIEALRLQNDVSAPAAGRIESVFVQDGQPVEYGQPLFEIVPEEVS